MKAKDVKIGKKVWYFPFLGLPEHQETTITSEPWEMCGTMVCFVEGKSGCVAIENLVEIKED